MGRLIMKHCKLDDNSEPSACGFSSDIITHTTTSNKTWANIVKTICPSYPCNLEKSNHVLSVLFAVRNS
jgi:hypothetical protein